MSSVSINLKSGAKFHKIEFTLPAAALACLNLGGSLDLTEVILPLLHAEALTGFKAGFNTDYVARFSFCDEQAEAYANNKYGVQL
jgi:hypothetical protein